MPIKISKVNGGSQEIKVPFGDEELTIWYKRDRLTVKRLKSLSSAPPVPVPAAPVPAVKGGGKKAEALSDTGQDARLDALLDFLASVVEGWDVVDEDGTPIAPTRAVFEDLLTLPALKQIMEALLAEQAPDPPSAEPSDATF